MEYLVPYDPAVAAQHHHHRQFGQQDGNESDEATGPGTLNVRSGEEGTVDMWAAKWAHRNDAVAAMQALQNPCFSNTFTASWSHTFGRPQHPQHNQNYANNFGPRRPSQQDTMSNALQNMSRSEPQLHPNYGGGPRWGNARRYVSGPEYGYQGEGKMRNPPVEFTEVDFPPLQPGGPGESDEGEGHRHGHAQGGRGRGTWGRRTGL
ncbi:hypothetical protein M422DRAFT_37790 [Sphaerobolus stellatus SS14]|uniref:Unplaced genomic scaffold SPHSTscaffold_262, whole genome shotgun sequence n=1 Tax=Sphaerobolus stellatus (strain SS14) TaxID=990650 RepID=A0A0C9UPJ3_SPHS4|nr:hypothetical protein M422DRAFT_37790 [Sphaerobolus stellatus SS14]